MVLDREVQLLSAALTGITVKVVAIITKNKVRKYIKRLIVAPLYILYLNICV